MRKIKVVSVVVIIGSVIALGLFMGKQMFSFLEEKSLPAVHAKPRVDKDSVETSADKEISQGTVSQPQAQLPPGGPAEAVLQPPLSEPGKVPAPSPAVVQTTAAAPPSPNTEVSANPSGAGNPPSNLVPGVASGPSAGEKWVAHALENGTKCRAEPDPKSRELMRVNKGTRGFVLEKKDGWTKIKWEFNRKIGWTRDDLLIQGPIEIMRSLVDPKGNIASVTTQNIQTAVKKAKTMAQNVSVAVAKPVPPSETVKGFVPGEKLPEEAKISADPFARVRETPDTKSLAVGRLPKGVMVKIKSAKQVGRHYWFQIQYNNGRKEGWTREDNLQF